jgi:photosystem II stability/assembly factor-like uncharacterized protein
MKLKIFVIIFLTAFSSATSQVQDYELMIDEGTYSVEEIVTVAEAYFADRDKGKGSGYKQFKRWEYNAKRIMNEDGYLPSISERMEALQAYNTYLNDTAQQRSSLADSWTELGPTSKNQTSGWNPGVGRITGIAVDRTNTDHIIVGANSGGVWRSIDAGQSWNPLNDFFSNLVVFSVAIDPQDSNTYYFGSSSGIIFKSTDTGATWTQIADMSNSLINKILIHPTDSDIMFASSQNAGVYGTIDGGVTWQSLITGGRAYDVEFKPGDTNTVYASGSGFFKSTDGGITFSAVSGFSTGAKMIGVSPADPEIVYVLEASGGIFGGLYKSSDSGATFSELDHAGNNYFGYSTTAQDNSGQAPRDMDVAVSTTNADEVHIAGVLTWRSMDAGVTFECTSDWVPGNASGANIGYCHADVDFMEFVGDTLFVGTDGGIFKADDTANLNASYYEDLTSGLGIRQFYRIGISQTQDVVITGGSQDNGSSVYSEALGWRDWLGADGMEGFVDKTISNRLYGTSQGGQLYRSTNGGSSYNGLSEPGQGGGEWVTPFEQDPLIPNTIYVGYNVVHKSINSGSSWTAISQAFSGDLDELKIAPSDNLIIYAANQGTIYRTLDAGLTNWETMTSPGGIINYISVHPSNPNKIAVATTSSNKVFVSEDGGATWINYKKNLPNFSALAVVWDDNGEDGLYVGMNYGIFYIDTTFTDWQPYNNLIPNVQISELEINATTGMIYASTYGRGLWVSPTMQPVLGVNDFISEKDINLFPNPAQNEITILLHEPLQAEVRIYDVTGKLIIFKAKSEINTNHTLNIAALKAGVYFIRLNTEAGTVTKKLIKN